MSQQTMNHQGPKAIDERPKPRRTPTGEANIQRANTTPYRYLHGTFFSISRVERASIADLDKALKAIRGPGVSVKLQVEWFGDEFVRIDELEVCVSTGDDRLPQIVDTLQKCGFRPVLDIPQMKLCMEAGVNVLD